MNESVSSPARTIHALFLAGPTACGKSALAVALAERVGAEILSCDSRQIYRGMAVGTAAPTREERRRVVHHLAGIVSPREDWSAGRWAEAAGQILDDLSARARPALVVGGSGLYARALRRGLAELPGSRRLRDALAREWAGERPEGVHARLARLDPEAARRIHPNNRPRVLRALEVCLASGRRISELWAAEASAADRFPAPLVALDVPREIRNARIDRRVEAMFAGGLLEEAEALLAAGFAPSWPSYRTLGYPEAVAVLRGEMSRSAAVTEVQRQTRAFARRQLTWLRGEPDVRWLPVDPAAPAPALERLEALFREIEPTRHAP